MNSEGTRRSFDPFRALSPSEREQHLASYLRYMEQRDGTVDFTAQSLARREVYFDELQRKPVEWEGPLDFASFERSVVSARKTNLDRRTAWLVVAAKANIGEAYGVEQELRRLATSGEDPTEDEPYFRMLLQEQCHSRILLEICRTGGVDITTPVPQWNQRVLIHIVMRLPDYFRWVLVIGAEIVGCTIFRTLIENCDVWSAEPEVEERMRSLLNEIWRDEILHVAFLRTRLGSRRLAVARRLAPLVAWAAMLDLPELDVLGASRAHFMANMRAGLEIPGDVTWIKPDPVGAG